jgi:hypothetical protein
MRGRIYRVHLTEDEQLDWTPLVVKGPRIASLYSVSTRQ